MKEIAALFLFIVVAIQSSGQVVFGSPKKKNQSNFTFSFQAAYGFISPDAVNAYINDQIQKQTSVGYYIVSGNPNISATGSFNLAPTVKINRKWKLRIPIEYGTGSKTSSVNNTSTTYSIHRFSPGLLGYYYHELENNTALFLGGGPVMNFMSFEKTSSSKLGARLELGLSWMRRSSDWDVFLMYNFAKGTTNDIPKEIDFSGTSFGIRVTL